MTRRKLSRRNLLAGLGATAAALPIFSSIPSAHSADFPTRLVIYYTPQEPIGKSYWEPGSGFALTEMLQPLTPHKDKILMVGDIDVLSRNDAVKAGHNLIGHILTNQLNSYFGQDWQFYAGGKSIDHYVAEALGVNPMVLGVGGGNNAFGTYRLSYTGKDEPYHPEKDPLNAFNSNFADFIVPPDELAALRAKRKRVLDSVGVQLERLRPQLTAEDRVKLERHIEQANALEDRLVNGNAGGLSCSPVAPGALDPSDNANIPQLTRNQIDVMVQALACDITQVGTLQIGSSGGFGTPQWPSEGIDIAKGDHDIAHEFYSVGGAQEIADRIALEKYHNQQFAYLLQQMDAVVEGDGTLLDHSVVFYVKSMSHNHNANEVMMMLAGGALTGGRYVSAGGGSSANLLVNVLNLMGLNDTTYGNPAYCSGPLSLG